MPPELRPVLGPGQRSRYPHRCAGRSRTRGGSRGVGRHAGVREGEEAWGRREVGVGGPAALAPRAAAGVWRAQAREVEPARESDGVWLFGSVLLQYCNF